MSSNGVTESHDGPAGLPEVGGGPLDASPDDVVGPTIGNPNHSDNNSVSESESESDEGASFIIRLLPDGELEQQQQQQRRRRRRQRQRQVQRRLRLGGGFDDLDDAWLGVRRDDNHNSYSGSQVLLVLSLLTVVGITSSAAFDFSWIGHVRALPECPKADFVVTIIVHGCGTVAVLAGYIVMVVAGFSSRSPRASAGAAACGSGTGVIVMVLGALTLLASWIILGVQQSKSGCHAM